jgi:NADPH2:quinone reductase
VTQPVAVSYSNFGEARDVLTLGPQAVAAPRAGEVVVRIHATGVNPSDVKKRTGWGSFQPPAEPIIPHSDGAGVVEAVGEGVSRDWIGRRVWLFNAQGAASYGGSGPEAGTAATYSVLPLSHVVPLPDNVSFEIGACLGVPARTAHYVTFCDGPVAGKIVLVQGGAGAVGELAVQFASAAGATVITTVSSPEKAEIARKAGAAHVIDRHKEDVVAAVRAIAPEGVDRIIEVDFGANAAIDARVLRLGGQIASFSSPSNRTPAIPYYPLQFTNAQIRLAPIFMISKADSDRGLADINFALSMGTLRPTLAAVYGLDEIATAHEHVETARTPGNVVVRIA